MKRVLAAASGGGHWEQMMLLGSVLKHYETHYVTTDAAMAEQHAIAEFSLIPDCNQNTPFRAAWCFFIAFWRVLRQRPDVVISTGAAPGFFCIFAGRLLGAKTLWLDSVANAEQLSMCGKLSRKIAHQCLTQWEHLQDDPSPAYAGSLI